MSRRGLVRQLVDIAARGEKITTTERGGRIVERKVTQDPSIQMKAIDQLSTLLDRADGSLTTERATYERKSYAD